MDTDNDRELPPPPTLEELSPYSPDDAAMMTGASRLARDYSSIGAASNLPQRSNKGNNEPPRTYVSLSDDVTGLLRCQSQEGRVAAAADQKRFLGGGGAEGGAGGVTSPSPGVSFAAQDIFSETREVTRPFHGWQTQSQAGGVMYQGGRDMTVMDEERVESSHTRTFSERRHQRVSYSPDSANVRSSECAAGSNQSASFCSSSESDSQQHRLLYNFPQEALDIECHTNNEGAGGVQQVHSQTENDLLIYGSLHEQRLEIHVVREAAEAPLGMSIAGGAGTTPLGGSEVYISDLSL